MCTIMLCYIERKRDVSFFKNVVSNKLKVSTEITINLVIRHCNYKNQIRGSIKNIIYYKKYYHLKCKKFKW